MSILIHIPKDSEILESDQQGFFDKLTQQGKDSFGFSYAKDGKLHIKKNFKKVENFIKEFRAAQNCSCVIHFADKPWGVDCSNYCGPYRLDENHVIGHVGRVWSAQSKLEKPNFCQSINLLILIKQLWEPELFGSECLKYLIEKAIAFENKIVILRNDGAIQTFNDNKAAENNLYPSFWFSNYVYLGRLGASEIHKPYKYIPSEDTMLVSQGQLCHICKERHYSPSRIRKSERGWVCKTCESLWEPSLELIESVNKKINDKYNLKTPSGTGPGTLTNIVEFPKSEKNSFISDLNLPDSSLIDVFQVI